MYSFTAIQDLSDCHTGFYLITVSIAIILVIVWWYCFSDEDYGFGWWMTGIGTIVLWLAHIASFTPYHPKNIAVTGYYIGVNPEVYVAREGKYDTEHHDLTVTYRVPEGDVTLKTCYGCTYPQQAILYKN